MNANNVQNDQEVAGESQSSSVDRIVAGETKNDKERQVQKKAAELTAEEVQSAYGSDIDCMAEQFNALLKNSSLAAAHCLPLDEVNIYKHLYEGVLLCALANLLQPGTIDPSAVNITSKTEMSMMQNRNLGLASLRQVGLSVRDLEKIGFSLDRPFQMTTLLVQMLRLITLGRMNFRDNQQLVHLFKDWGSDQHQAKAIFATEREKMLLLWVNYQLRKDGTTDTVLKDFGEGLADSSVYATLFWVVAPIRIRGTLHNVSAVTMLSDLTKRAQLVVSNADKLGIRGAIKPEHIVEAGKQDVSSTKGLHNYIINVAFLYRLFEAYASIDVPKMTAGKSDSESSTGVAAPTTEQLKMWCKYGASEETLIRWLNSFGRADPVVSLEMDLCNGIILLKVWDAMIPGCVQWSHVKTDDEIKHSLKRVHVWSANCHEVIKCGEKVGITRSTCSESDIVFGNVKNISALVFLMMRLHSQLARKRALGGGADVAELDDDGLTKWFNARMKEYGSTFQLKGIEDPRLKNTNALGFIGERVLSEKRELLSGPAALLKTADPKASSAAQKTPATQTQADPSASSAVQKTPNSPASSGAQKTANSPASFSAQKTADPPASSALQKTADPPASSAAHKTADPPASSAAQKTTNSPASSAAQKTTNSPASSAAQKTTNSPASSAAQKTADPPASSAASINHVSPDLQKTEDPLTSSAPSTPSQPQSQKAVKAAVTIKVTVAEEMTYSKQSRSPSKGSRSMLPAKLIKSWDNQNAVDSDHEEPENVSNASNSTAWLFESVVQLNGDEQSKFSIAAILMFHKAGIIVYASKLGPDTDVAVYRSVLLQLNALSTVKA